MSLGELSDANSVLKAINEFDELGRDAFLDRYGFGKSWRYQIRHDGKLYDSKAIVGAAHGYQFDRPLRHEDFSGGLRTHVPKLRAMGFEIVDLERSSPDPTNAFIFQANPKYYDIGRAVQSLDEMNWLVAQSRNQIHVSDHVYIWQSGPGGGIVAEGTILTAPAISTDQEGAEFIVNPEKFEGEQLRVRISIDRVIDPPLFRSALKEHATLKDLGILRFANATNFLLPPEHHEALQSLLGVSSQVDSSVWWVNQGSTYRQEREGGYLWAPQRGRDGRSRAHWDSMRDVRPGDSILHYANGSVRAVGKALGGAKELPRPTELPDEAWTSEGLQLRVEYLDLETPIALDLLPVDLRARHGGPFTRDGAVQQGYLFRLQDDIIEFLAIHFPELGLDTTMSQQPPERLSLSELERSAEAEPFELQLDRKIYAAVVAALESGKHVVLTGPPGTAKTTLAQATAEAAKRLRLCDGYVLTTATADWTTYETIGGLKPGEQGKLVFAAGHFLEAIEKNHWLIIDELNRSQFDRAFGQLFTVLSGQPVTLPYKRPGKDGLRTLVPAGADQPGPDLDPLFIPADWRIVATMNVFDKSLLFEMSYALMRRFAFIEVASPSDEIFRNLIEIAAEGDASATSVAVDLLRVREIKDIGPAVFQDIAAFAAQQNRIGLVDPMELRYQSFYSYLLPQFEGISDDKATVLLDLLVDVCGSEARVRIRQTLTEVLGAELQSSRLPGGSDEEAAFGQD